MHTCVVTDVAGVVDDPTPTTLEFGATALAIRGNAQLWLLVCPKLGSRVARVHRYHPSRVYMYRGCAHANLLFVNCGVTIRTLMHTPR